MNEHRESEPQLPPIQYWFILRTVPSGPLAPEEIKQQWIGVPLPCRKPFIEGMEPYIVNDVILGRKVLTLVEDGVVIRLDDAIKSLMLFDRADAGSWWNNLSVGIDNSTLIFRADEGQALPIDTAERILPGLTNFDELGYWL
jgi:hypothetical protein